MLELIFKAFKEWLSGPVEKYCFADSATYSGVSRNDLYQASLNAYLKSEADIQVKFGGFLETCLMDHSQELTVHAELNVYKGNPSWWADLSVHDVSSGLLWTTRDVIVKTTRSVIEVKFANYKDPNWIFKNNHVKRDLERLASLQSKVDRILVLMDEGGGIDQNHIDETLETAKENDISVLSNSDKLMHIVSE